MAGRDGGEAGSAPIRALIQPRCPAPMGGLCTVFAPRLQRPSRAPLARRSLHRIELLRPCGPQSAQRSLGQLRDPRADPALARDSAGAVAASHPVPSLPLPAHSETRTGSWMGLARLAFFGKSGCEEPGLPCLSQLILCAFRSVHGLAAAPAAGPACLSCQFIDQLNQAGKRCWSRSQRRP